MERYDHQTIEKKWQQFWADQKSFGVKEDSSKQKFYGLIEFPYPSGDGLHTGHMRSNTAMDIICRKRRMEGYNVLYPIGFDSFGLPAENYAVKKKVKPQITTRENIETFTRQLKGAGFSFDWSRVFSTTDEEYYKWTQWVFVQLYKQGLAYKAKEDINWCTSCKIGLANEEVVSGVCERCGGEVVKKEKEQWLLRITKYADRLIRDLETVDYLPRIKEQQINWIGRSEGAEIDFQIKDFDRKLNVFTTRPDTLFGATYMVLAPEHTLVHELEKEIENLEEVKAYITVSRKKTDIERTDLSREKTGVELKGVHAINPVNNEEIPIWIADYVLIGYGTGAIMAVPAHDTRDYEFAKKFSLPVVEVISGGDIGKEAYVDNRAGRLINSGEFDGQLAQDGIQNITKWLEQKSHGKATVNYKLRDWIFSRQRYWGEPIPMIHCDKCGWLPVAEKELPVVLPDIDDFMPTEEGESPLAKLDEWVKVKCSKCGGEAKRETDVMPNWAGSNWYFMRYADPHNSNALIDKHKAKYWLPVDWYNGGMEHTTLHVLYSRFIYKFLFDIGVVPPELGSEPYRKRTAHGMILGHGGVKMSKSEGNVINPDDFVEVYGADTLRVYEMFMGPFDQAIAWDDKGVVGVRKFLDRVYRFAKKVESGHTDHGEVTKVLHQSIKKVSRDIEQMRFNTAVAQMMVLSNLLEKQDRISREVLEKFVLILSPFAPHLGEELWSQLGHKESLAYEPWPEFDEQLAREEEIELVVQVNGKVRDKIMVSADIAEAEAKQLALESKKVKKFLGGQEPKQVIFARGKLVNLVV